MPCPLELYTLSIGVIWPAHWNYISSITIHSWCSFGSKRYRNELNFRLSASKPAQTLLLNFHTIIRFQPFHFYPQTLCRKGIAAETRKYYPLQEGTVDKGECFQHFQLFSGLPIELYIQCRGMYTHHAGFICPPCWIYRFTVWAKVRWNVGLWLLARGMKHTNMWAVPNRACIWIKQRFCYNEMQASFCYNRASVDSKYRKRTFAFRSAFRKKCQWKGTFLKNWRLKAVFLF